MLRSHRSKDAGFSLLEVMMALAVLAVALLGLGALLVTNETARAATAETVLATHRLRSVAETIRSVQFADADFMFGNLTFVDAASGATVTTKSYLNELDTSPDALLLGFPRDLNGDGLVDNTNVTNYVLLPMMLTITVEGTTYCLHFLLSNED